MTKTIAQLPAASQAFDTDLLEASQSGVSRKVTRAQMLAGVTAGSHTHPISDVVTLQAALDAKVGTVDTPLANQFARFTDDVTLQGRTVAQVKSDLDLEVGVDFPALSHTHTVSQITNAGTAAALSVGTAIGNVVQLGNVSGSAALPAVNGSLLTGLAGGGDMLASVYDPQTIADDAFDRANHTGEMSGADLTEGTVPLEALADGDADYLIGFNGVGQAESKDPAAFANPPQVSAGEITSGNSTDLRTYAPADVVAFVNAHGGGGGLTTELDTATAVTVGAATNGEHHVLTSDSAITLTLDAQATAGMESAFTRAGAGVVSVAVESGAGYWVPSDDIGGAPATTGFTMTGYGYFIVIRNTGGNAAEWLFVGQSSLAASIDGPLVLGTGGSLSDSGPISATGTLTKVLHGGRVVLTTGNVVIPNAAGDVGMGGMIKADASRTVSFNSTSLTLATGDLLTYYVQSTTVLIRRKSIAADSPAMV